MWLPVEQVERVLASSPNAEVQQVCREVLWRRQFDAPRRPVHQQKGERT